MDEKDKVKTFSIQEAKGQLQCDITLFPLSIIQQRSSGTERARVTIVHIRSVGALMTLISVFGQRSL